MIFSNSPTIKNSKPVIFIDSNNEGENFDHLKLPISQVLSTDQYPYVRFLGVLIDPALSFQPHVKYISNKLSKSLYILRKVQNLLTEKALKAIYFSLFHCNLIYCLPIWSTASQSILKQIILLQKKLLE